MNCPTCELKNINPMMPDYEMELKIDANLGACLVCPNCGHIEPQEDDDGEL